MANISLGDRSLIVDVLQGSDEWLAARRGKVTGSRMKDVIDFKIKKPTKNDPEPQPTEGAKRIMYRREIVTERLIGDLGKKDIFITDAMKWGTMNESIARTNYQLRTGKKVEQIGMMRHPKLEVGYSPDGLVGDEGMIEIKCLEPWNHLYEIVRKNQMPETYKAQVQMGLWITNRLWCDFIGYDSREPAGLDLFAVRIERDQDYINYLEAETIKFLSEVEHDVNFYLGYLPFCVRICHACGVVFNDKLAFCHECKSSSTEIKEVLQEAENKLLNTLVAQLKVTKISAGEAGKEISRA